MTRRYGNTEDENQLCGRPKSLISSVLTSLCRRIGCKLGDYTEGYQTGEVAELECHRRCQSHIFDVKARGTVLDILYDALALLMDTYAIAVHPPRCAVDCARYN
eukprot:gnl/TRDRNA2_/TRDRNA2_135574_c3_seq1.p1 gnl/TRDRNA2_/TRDRNA2_135574_c3~~gnl/TRDRNA2_/TRDRNA2_135574_c3_seq1.p1  ORF type:complete len:104 (+),score=4.54 gnl/TRDRNA2_/TRDRNA2_135574_c3_seq1:164-475(+)